MSWGRGEKDGEGGTTYVTIQAQMTWNTPRVLGPKEIGLV